LSHRTPNRVIVVPYIHDTEHCPKYNIKIY
jgi:hypothetical protein